MKTVKNNILFIIAVLFIVAPLAVWAQASFSPDPFPLLTRGAFKTNLVLTQSSTQEVISRSADGFYWVVSGVPFTMTWNARAPLVGDGTEPVDQRSLSSEGIVCRKSWSSDLNAAGTVTAALSAKRTFYMSCSGLGGAVFTYRAMRVGTIDLIPVAPSIGGLVQKQNAPDKTLIAGDATFSVSAKNVGNVATYRSFNVSLSEGMHPAGVAEGGSFDPLTSVSFNTIEKKPIAVLAAGKTAEVTFKLSTTDRTSGARYYLFCVDGDENGGRISESNLAGNAESGGGTMGNNCKAIGPYRFVAP